MILSLKKETKPKRTTASVNMAIVTHRPIPAQAMGPGKESLRARKKLACVLF